MLVALEVPSVALLVIPSSASAKRAAYDLRNLGIDARLFNFTSEGNGREYLIGNSRVQNSAQPKLLICTPATSRGLDMPELTHVLILGIPESGSDEMNSDTYLHLAGRVGRFGRAGQVVTIIDTDAQRKDMSRISNILRLNGIRPVKINMFD
jgi:superfamily II DNA/RNA helicase